MQQAPLAVAVGGRRSSPGPGGTSGFVPQPGRMLGGTTPKFVLNCRMHQLRRRAAPLPLAGSQATKDYSKRGTSSSERARARPERRPQPLSFGAAWQLSRRWRRPWSRSLDDLLAAVGADDAIKRYIAARRITTTTHIIHPFIAGARIDGTDHGLSRRPEEGHHDAPLCRGLTPVDGGGRGRGGLVGSSSSRGGGVDAGPPKTFAAWNHQVNIYEERRLDSKKRVFPSHELLRGGGVGPDVV